MPTSLRNRYTNDLLLQLAGGPTNMKACPRCGRSYADDSLNYCLDDGADLVYGPSTDEPATAIIPGDASEARSQLQGGLGSWETVPPKDADADTRSMSSGST